MKKFYKNILLVVLLLFTLSYVASFFESTDAPVGTISIGELAQKIQEGVVKQIVITQGKKQ